MSTPIESSADKTPFGSAYSLRSRYLSITALITLLIVTGALYAQHYVAQVGELRSDNLRRRNEASVHIRQLRNALLSTEKNLDEFLWVPDEQRRTLVTQAIDSSITEQQNIYHLKWFINSHMALEMDDFASDLKGLRTSIVQLMDRRIDPEHQDPYLALHAKVFQPATRDLNQAITSALLHLESSPGISNRAVVRKSLEDVRAEWMRLDILAEGYSGISQNGKEKAEQKLGELARRHQELLTALASLEHYFSKNPLLKHDWQVIQQAVARWNSGLNQLQQLVGKGLMRGDIHFLVTSVEPQLAHIWNYLQKLDEKLEEMSSHDVDELNNAATTIAHALWLLALTGLVLLITALIYFERNVLSPIALVARALRSEARGLTPPPLPPVQSRETHHLVDAFNQMRQQVQQRQKSLEHLALHDTLTGIANREQLVREMMGDISAPLEATLLVIGLNRFKEINNSLGHAIGDQLLVAVTNRLKTIDTAITCLARIGGDEFALLLKGSEATSSDWLARQIIRELEAPFAVADQSLYISASIGIARSPEHGHSPLELLQKGELAMHVAKEHKSEVVHYNTKHDRHAVRRLGLANDLRRALRESQQELSIAYQPQLEVATGRFCGTEALLRWNHPKEGIVSPDEIIPIAENTGIIFHLTPWVLERAFDEYTSLKHTGERPQLAINMSVFNLYDGEFPRKLDHLLSKWTIDPVDLQLEITESAMMEDPKRAQGTLQQINAMGIELAIDDFGTGFSSLSYLKHFPVSKLKIDKSFVMSMFKSDNDAVIIRSTIDMAHNLGLRVVAEGVETQESFDLLSILGCDIAQGYLISRPLPRQELELWQRKQSSIAASPPRWAMKK